MTKQQKRDYYVTQWINSYYHSVDEFYGRCSDAKRSAEMSILRTMGALNGRRYRILCGSCSFYTCGYAYKNPETGNWILVVDTAYNTFQFILTEAEVRLAYLEY